MLSKDLGLDTRITTLGHVQRGGGASAYDRMLSTLQGVEAVEAVLDAKPDTPTPMIAVNENKITRKPLMDAVRLTHAVADAIAAKDFDKAMGLRDAEFEEYYRAYMITTATDQPDLMLPEHKVCRFRPILEPEVLTVKHQANAHCLHPCWGSCGWYERSNACGGRLLLQPRTYSSCNS